jgi:hypothetical protein
MIFMMPHYAVPADVADIPQISASASDRSVKVT